MQSAASGPRTRFILTLTTCLLLGLAVPAWPLDSPFARATLKGITAIKVVVEELEPEAERDGLTKDQLQTDVELRLRKAGIRVTSALLESGGSYLYLNVGTDNKHPSGPYAVSIDLEFKQWVILERNRNVSLLAPTWYVGSIVLVGAHKLRHIRDIVAGLVDQFINPYLEQNPKP
jgi:hypothetical protein